MTTFDTTPTTSATPSVDGGPLSFAQQRLWLLDQTEPARWAYNVVVARRLQGPLDVAVLQRALDEVVARHETLRTTIATRDGVPEPVVRPAQPFELHVLDLRDRGCTLAERETAGLVAAQARRWFDLANGPVIRGLLVRLAADEWVLTLTMHHIATDAWSESILLDEVRRLYNAFRRGEPSPLAPLPVQYRDFARWQRERLRPGALDVRLQYWCRQLDGLAPTLDLPSDRPRPAQRSGRGATVEIVLDAARTAGLRRVASAARATVFMTLLAAYQAVLARYSGVRDIAVGTAIANRSRKEHEPLIGFFANTLVLRTDLSGNPPFVELLARVRAVALDAYQHQDLPFERLVKELRPHRSLSHSALFQHMFVYQNTPGCDLVLDGVRTAPYPFTPDTAMFDLTLTLREEGDEVTGTLEYATDLFDEASARRFVRHFERLVDAVVAAPDRPIDDIDLLDDDERDALVRRWNDTAAPYPQRPVHELFEAHAAASPGATAVTAGGASVTYRELDEAANRLAGQLETLGTAPEARVGVCLPRSYDAIVAMLATLKAGGAYVPLDPEYPPARLAWMLDDAGVDLVVTNTACRERLASHPVRVICLDDPADAATIASMPARRAARSGISPDNLAYVMYTSGSTGTPKGVMVEHGAIVSLLFGTDFVDFDAVGALLHMAPLAFDASTFEVWGALLHGKRCVVVTDRHFALDRFGTLLEREQVDTLWLTAALFNFVVDEGAHHLRGVRQLIVGGEALSPAHVARALELLPRTRLVNGYGPTEATTFAATHDITHEGMGASSVPIGRPLANTRLYVLDDQRRPAPIGVVGELHVGGAGLARGYVGDAALTAAKFVADPFGSEPNARLYRTGDLARVRADGVFEFVGRTDDQVKIRGFRVEPGEVETALHACPGVGSCAVVAGRRDSQTRLVAYVVATCTPAPSSETLRDHLRARLPDHLVPAGFVVVDALPRTANGKLDRDALPPFEPEAGAAFVAARTPTERALATLWSELLGVARPGIDDDFFALGGDSLTAAALVAQMQHATGRAIPLSSLFVRPTIRGIAAALDAPAEDDDDTSVVVLQAGGAKLPLFLAHGVSGLLLRYGQLVRRLDPEQPVYGLRPPAAFVATRRRLRIEELAARYADDIVARQPRGPYRLAGFCFGGVVVVEVAHQLETRGHTVEMLALFDAEPPTAPRPARVKHELAQLVSLARRDEPARAYIRRRIRNAITKVRRFPWAADYWLHVRTGRPLSRRWNDVERVQRLHAFPLQRSLNRALGAYVAPRPACPVTMFRAGDAGVTTTAIRCIAATDTTGECFLVDGPGVGHDSLMDEPHVAALADALTERLDRGDHALPATVA